ncbi:MAG: metal ABC transporter permease [Hyphomicrobiaceae bacterium]|nr:metal ABC transporter permease [Hyphomicrobiaceae bacterium]
MLDDFFVRAMVAGIGVALIAAPLGCFMVWRRMAYFGDTLSHSALLGVALGLLLQINIVLSVFVVAALVSVALLVLQRDDRLTSDTALGILSHSALALGLVVIAFLPGLRVDLMSYLFGDILAVSRFDIGVIYGGGLLILALLALIWRPLLAQTVSAELALSEGLNPQRANLVYMLLVALGIAIAMKIVGILLITALLIIPAATARIFSKTPEQMAAYAMLVGVGAVIVGLMGSMQSDTPSGPSIVVAALLFFLLGQLVGIVRSRSTRNA